MTQQAFCCRLFPCFQVPSSSSDSPHIFSRQYLSAHRRPSHSNFPLSSPFHLRSSPSFLFFLLLRLLSFASFAFLCLFMHFSSIFFFFLYLLLLVSHFPFFHSFYPVSFPYVVFFIPLFPLLPQSELAILPPLPWLPSTLQLVTHKLVVLLIWYEVKRSGRVMLQTESLAEQQKPRPRSLLSRLSFLSRYCKRGNVSPTARCSPHHSWVCTCVCYRIY